VEARCARSRRDRPWVLSVVRDAIQRHATPYAVRRGLGGGARRGPGPRRRSPAEGEIAAPALAYGAIAPSLAQGTLPRGTRAITPARRASGTSQ
jgi:hypothetical protein